MRGTKGIRNILEQLAPTFSKTGIECVEAFFSPAEKCEIHLPWEVVEQLQGKFDRILTIGSSNQNYSAIGCAGIQNESLCAFTKEEEVSSAEASDILGEFLNTYTGMLSDHEEFTKHFGILIQGVPVLYTDGHSYLPFIWGIQGYLYVGIHWIYVGFSVRRNLEAIPPR